MATPFRDMPFIPPLWLSNPHIQTLTARFRPRRYLLRNLQEETRLFQVDPESRILAVCHWQLRRSSHPALVLVHGLEGCHESHYMRGIAHKAWHAGFHVIRFNQRNCAGTEHLTPSLYNGGMSQDIRMVVEELSNKDGIPSIWLTGYSMGGNLVLKMAGETRDTLPTLKGVGAVCPNIHPAACVAALEQRRNWIYHEHFLVKLKARLKRKALLFPGKWDVSRYRHIRTMSQFDDAYTAPDGGFRDAADYYEQTGSRHILHQIKVPTLIITAQDDPFIPFGTFNISSLHANPFIHLITPPHGGHCGFIQRPRKDEDCHWAENRILDFIQNPDPNLS